MANGRLRIIAALMASARRRLREQLPGIDRPAIRSTMAIMFRESVAFGWIMTTLVAQAPGVAELRRDLQAANAPTVAWAAQVSRIRRDHRMVAPLQSALGSWRRRTDEDARLVCLHLLDALIALDAKVPAGELLELVDTAECGAAAFVLLVREHRTNQVELMALFRRDLEHFAATPVWGTDQLVEQRERRTAILGEVLAWHSPPGFVAIVAPRCDWRVQVTVRDAGKPLPRVFGCTGPRPVAAAPNWPARPALWLDHQHGRSDASRIAILPTLEFVVTREQMAEGEQPGGKLWSFAVPVGESRRMPFEVQWLVVAGSGEHPRLGVDVPYDTDAAFLAAATTARDRAQACVDGLRARFIASGELTAAEAAKWLPARIGVEVTDLRASPATPLPALPPPK